MSRSESEHLVHTQTWLTAQRVERGRLLARIDQELEALSTEECFECLRTGGLGRVGFVSQGLAVVLPVNFAMRGREVVFLTGSGSKLEAVEAGAPLTFEIDHLGEDGLGWSVLAAGPAWSTSSPATVIEIQGLGVHPPSPATRTHAVGLEILAVTGRRFGSGRFALDDREP
jgi:hypothetical protein